MKKFILIIFTVILLVFSSCSSIKQKDADMANKNSIVFAQLDEANKKWLTNVNKDSDAIGEMYHEVSALFPGKGSAVQGRTGIVNYFKSISEVTEIIVDARFIDNANYICEMGHFITINNDKYQYVVGWKKIDGTWLREIELIGKKTAGQPVYSEFDTARTKWMALCNDSTKGAKELIEGAFTENAYYHNKGRLLHGWKEIINEYSYANDSNYRLYLEQKITVMAENDLAYEIGGWRTGNYSGCYIFRWEKQAEGEWKVSLDSNY